MPGKMPLSHNAQYHSDGHAWALVHRQPHLPAGQYWHLPDLDEHSNGMGVYSDRVDGGDEIFPRTGNGVRGNIVSRDPMVGYFDSTRAPPQPQAASQYWHHQTPEPSSQYLYSDPRGHRTRAAKHSSAGDDGGSRYDPPGAPVIPRLATPTDLDSWDGFAGCCRDGHKVDSYCDRGRYEVDSYCDRDRYKNNEPVVSRRPQPQDKMGDQLTAALAYMTLRRAREQEDGRVNDERDGARRGNRHKDGDRRPGPS